jgi:uncharacterized RDD family membrane protein YckC
MIARCPECNVTGQLDDKLAGQQTRCPQCGENYLAKPSQQVRWYYAAGDTKMGPFDPDQFDRLVAEGTVTPDTLVWRKGMERWQPLSGERPSSPTKWYYAEGHDKIGPLDQDRFDRLIADGTISDKTLVWRKGMESWQGLADTIVADSAAEQEQCGGCGGSFAPLLLTSHGKEKMCAACRLDLLQFDRNTSLNYGNLLTRLIAKVIDLLFMLALAGLVEGLSRNLYPASYADNIVTPVFAATLAINMLLGIFYITWFVGKFGATPGKMVVKLKVTDPAGGKLGYFHAFGRYCGEFIAALGIMGFMILVVFWTVSSMFSANLIPNSIAVAIFVTFGLIYGPAPFDLQRRTLYDRLCNTRVVAA